MKKITLLALFLVALPAASWAQDCPAVPAPYTLDFENAAVPSIPACTTQSIGFGPQWNTVSNPGHGFTDIALHRGPSIEQSESWFFTQGITLTPGTYTLSYRYGNDSTTTTEKLRSVLVTDPQAPVTSYIGTHDAITGGTPTNFSFPNPITISETATYYIGFNAYSDTEQGNLYIDNISLRELVCGVPQSVSVDAITTTTATLNWLAQTGPVTIGYFYGVNTTDVPPAPSNIRMTPNLTINLDNLAPGTNYFAYVSTLCGSTTSDWISVPFTTLSTAGLNDAVFASFKVYPNPAKNILTLDNATAIEKAEVYNVTGQLVLQQEVKSTNAQINIEKLSAGAYFLHIYAGNAGKSVKILKQ